MMATQSITFNDGQKLLPSDRDLKDVQPTQVPPGTDKMHCSSGFLPASAAPLDAMVAEFHITDDLNACTTVRKYEYDPTEDCDDDSNEMHCNLDLDFLPKSAAPLDPVIVEFSATYHPDARTTVRKYEYNPSEDCDDDSKLDSDDEEGWATAVEQEDIDGEDGGWFTAVSHFSDAADMEVYGSYEGQFARQQDLVQLQFLSLVSPPVRSLGLRETM